MTTPVSMEWTSLERELLLRAAKDVVEYCRRGDFNDLDFGLGLQSSGRIAALEIIIADIELGTPYRHGKG